MNKRILALYTGGTIGMIGEPLRPGSLAGLQANIPQLADLPYDITYEVLFADGKPIDSSDADRELINRITQRIGEVHDHYDGIVVISGTDTMAPMAATVDYLLEGLNTPVIFTGSMKPANAAGSDGPRNLINAINTAATSPLKEVVISMWERLIRATQAHKYDTDKVDTFISLDDTPLGTYDEHNVLHLNEARLRPANERPLVVHQLDLAVSIAPLSVDLSQFTSDTLLRSLLTDAYEKSTVILLHSGAASKKDTLRTAIQSTISADKPVFYTEGQPVTSGSIYLVVPDNFQQAMAKVAYITTVTKDPNLLRQLAEANLRGEGAGPLIHESDLLDEQSLHQEGRSEIGPLK